MKGRVGILLGLSVLASGTPARAQRACDLIGVCIDIPAIVNGGDGVSVDVPRPKVLPRLIESIPRVITELPGTMSGLAPAIRGAKARAERSAQPMPAHLRQQMQRYFNDSLLAGVRYSTDWGAAQNGTLHQVILGNHQAVAITLDNVIVFADGRYTADLELWAHELTHVEQYSRMGIDGFASRYVQAHWTLENEATDRANAVRLALENEPAPTHNAQPPTHDSHPAYRNTPPQTSWTPVMVASACQTNYGWCPMAVAVAVGAPCYCPTYAGPVWGVAR